MQMKKNTQDLLIILFVSFIFIVPFLLSKAMIIGSDSIFHFNRFYDTAMQMKNGNFQYFISMYGFQQSGRIVNALYGPMIAYFHGGLVLLSHSWFQYQILSNFILFVLSGFSIYFFLTKAKIILSLRLPISIIYMTTFSILYWITRQGFSSWGAALLPICLLPIIDLVNKKQIRPVELGLLTALMVQTHLFSSLLLILIYLPFFTYAWFNSSVRIKLTLNLLLSIVLFLFLTLNIWYSFFDIYGHHEILSPFINQTMSKNTINSNSFYWLFVPAGLFLMLLFELFHGLRFWTESSPLHKLTWTLMAFFLFLSTSLIPWSYLVKQGNSLAELIQFPFRFFVPCTILLLFSFCLTVQKHFLKPEWKHKKIFTLFVWASMAQVLILISVFMFQWHNYNTFEHLGKHTSLYSEDEQEIKRSFFDSDLSKSLYFLQKATPDYLPLNTTNIDSKEKNKYETYKQEVIDKNAHFSKTIKKDTLIVEWIGDKENLVDIPIIKYYRTQLVFNGEKVKNNAVMVSSIGALKLLQKKGSNTLNVTYSNPPGFTQILVVTVSSWIVCTGIVVLKINE